MLTWPVKDPDAILDYQVDWTDWLQVSETISTSVFAVVEGDVVINSQPVPAGGVCKVWLSGGTIGTACVLRSRITTSMGRTDDRSVRLRIRSR